MLYKIRRKKDGLFFCGSSGRISERKLWSIDGNCYSSFGRALSAVKNAMRWSLDTSDPDFKCPTLDNSEVVEFALSEVRVIPLC